MRIYDAAALDASAVTHVTRADLRALTENLHFHCLLESIDDHGGGSVTLGEIAAGKQHPSVDRVEIGPFPDEEPTAVLIGKQRSDPGLATEMFAKNGRPKSD